MLNKYSDSDISKQCEQFLFCVVSGQTFKDHISKQLHQYM